MYIIYIYIIYIHIYVIYIYREREQFKKQNIIYGIDLSNKYPLALLKQMFLLHVPRKAAFRF